MTRNCHILIDNLASGDRSFGQELYVADRFSTDGVNNVSACSLLLLSTTGLFPAGRKILEHETQKSLRVESNIGNLIG